MANANYLIQGSTMTAIANAIRAKTGGSSPIDGEYMATEIASISGGGYETKIDNVAQSRDISLISNDLEVCGGFTFANLLTQYTRGSVTRTYIEFYKNVSDGTKAHNLLLAATNSTAGGYRIVDAEYVGRSGQKTIDQSMIKCVKIGGLGYSSTDATYTFNALRSCLLLNNKVYFISVKSGRFGTGSSSGLAVVVDLSTPAGAMTYDCKVPNTSPLYTTTPDSPTADGTLVNRVVAGSARISDTTAYILFQDGTFAKFDINASETDYFTILSKFTSETIDSSSANYSTTPLLVIGTDCYVFVNSKIYKYTAQSDTWSLFYEAEALADSPVSSVGGNFGITTGIQMFIPHNLINASPSNQYIGIASTDYVWWIPVDYSGSAVRSPYRKDTLPAPCNYGVASFANFCPFFSTAKADYYTDENGKLYKTPDGLTATDLSIPNVVCKNYVEGPWTT